MTHNVCFCPFEDFNNRAFPATFSIDTRDTCDDPVTIHDHAHFPGREKQITPPTIGRKKPEAIGMPDNPTMDQVHFADATITTTAITDDLTIPLHRLEPIAQGLQIGFLIQTQVFRKLLRGHGGPIIIQHLHDELTTGNRIIILLSFPLLERIFRFRHKYLE